MRQMALERLDAAAPFRSGVVPGDCTVCRVEPVEFGEKNLEIRTEQANSKFVGHAVAWALEVMQGGVID